MDYRGRRENSPGPYMYAQDSSGCLSPRSDPEGMLCTLDDKERLRPFCFSLQHGVGHGKRLCPSWEGAGGCGCNWAAVLVCGSWHCSVIHSSQGMALQRLCVLFLFPVSQCCTDRARAPCFAANIQLCTRGFVLWGWFASLQRCGSRGSVLGYSISSALRCMCMSVPNVMDVRLH